MALRLSIALLVSVCAFAAAPPIDTSISMRSVTDAEVSPDGRYVAFSVEQANWEENAFVTQIWIAVTATGERYQLTSGKKSSSDPAWSPDSRRLAFGSDRDGKLQIYVISPRGGEAAQLTAEENGISSFAWSPDGDWIAYTSTGPDTKARKDRKEKYGDFDIIGGDYTMNHLWRVKVPAEMPYDIKKLGKPEQLTRGEQFTVGAFSWSPDGSQIAFDAARDPDAASQDTRRIYALELAGLHVRKLVDTAGPNSSPKWSPDGKQIAYVTSEGDPFFYYANRSIATVASDGGTPSVLTRDFDEVPSLIDWGPDGIYFTARQKTAAHIYRLDPASRSVRRISGPDDFYIVGASFTKNFEAMAAIGAEPNHFAEVFVSPTAGFSPRYLTDMASQWKEYTLATREVIQWKSGDGVPIEGVLIKPADYDPSRKYPLLVVICNSCRTASSN
jgi:Tol biopolymer transport system component